MLRSLRASLPRSPEKIVKKFFNEVERFVGGAPEELESRAARPHGLSGSVALNPRLASTTIALLRSPHRVSSPNNMSHDAESTVSTVSRSTEIIEVETRTRRPRGFAALDAAARSAISRKGGQAAHRAGTAHKFTSDEAREAGKKGSQVTHARRRAGSAMA